MRVIPFSNTLIETEAVVASDRLRDEFQRVRHNTVALCEPLETEDYGLQAMANTSPPKWHLAHTSWFFETFVLRPFVPEYQVWNPYFEHLFNSYYNGIGTPFQRPQRGLLSRPTVAEVLNYRAAIDCQILALLAARDDGDTRVLKRIELGLHHEQQHQELLLTDLKYCFHINPLKPAYLTSQPPTAVGVNGPNQNWLEFPQELVSLGAAGDGFAFDNETPRHRQFLEPYALSQRPVSNGDFLGFMADDGYKSEEISVDRKSTRLNSSHVKISYAVFCLKKKKKKKY